MRRYPRKFSAYDMEQDIIALLEDKPLPEPSPAFDKVESLDDFLFILCFEFRVLLFSDIGMARSKAGGGEV